MRNRVLLLLRIGVAFAFIYPPVRAFIDPFAWVGYFPSFMLGIVSDQVLLQTFSAIEIIIGFWILFGKKIFIPSIVAAGILALIVLFNITQMDVLFRDIPIALMALALALAERQENRPFD